MDLRARADDTALVRAAQAGDGHAFGLLFERWSTRVVDVAYRIVRDREVAAEVAQDAFLAAWTGLGRLEQAESFGGWLLRIGRNRALDRLERERRSVPVGDEETTMLDRTTDRGDEAGDAAARAEDAELVWAAAAALGPRDASVLDLHLRHGLAPAEIAEELGVTPNTAHQVLFRLRARLGDAVRACVLWRAGHPACPVLATAAADAGVTAFGADAVRVVTAHAEGCADCTARQEARLAPEALFAAAPLLVVAPDVLATIRWGLADAGVPIDAPAAGAPGGIAGEAAGRAADGADDEPPGSLSARRPALLAAAAGVLVLVVVAVLLLGDDGGTGPDEIAADGTTTSSTSDPSTPSTADERASTTTGQAASTTTASTMTTPPGVSSLPAPTAPATTTTGPSADIGTTTAPGLAPNPPTTRPTPPTPTTAPPTPTTAEPPPAPPTIISFTATRVAGPGCATPSQRVALSWRTSGATDVRVTGPGAPSGSQPSFGTGTGCSAGPGTYVLTASGPGGSVSRTAVA